MLLPENYTLLLSGPATPPTGNIVRVGELSLRLPLSRIQPHACVTMGTHVTVTGLPQA